jgi:intracellular sulfur oxidation DsrE/DsrF family protein
MSSKPRPAPVTILVTRDGMGTAEPELAHKLAGTYFNLLELQDLLPQAVCFYAEGIRLVTKGSPILEELRSLEAKGVRLIVCGTCVNHYHVAEQVRVGRVGSMKDIIAAQWESEKVITI